MPKKLFEFLRKPGGRYLLIGGSVYVLELVVIVIAQQLGASGTVAVGISFWVGLIISFILQKLVTFGDKRTHHKVLLPQIAAFSLLVIFNFSFTILVTHWISPPAPAFIARTVALGVTTIWNFYLYKTRIFKNGDNVVY